MEEDIRWKQRFNNLKRAFASLEAGIQLAKERELSDLEKQGIIQAFEFTHELAWKTLKDFLQEKGNHTIYGSKDATKESFQLGLIEDGKSWMDMIVSRNLSSHTYDIKLSNHLFDKIISVYYDLFNTLIEKMEGIADE